MTYDILLYGNGLHYFECRKIIAQNDAEALKKAKDCLGKGKASISPASTVETVKVVKNGSSTVDWLHL